MYLLAFNSQGQHILGTCHNMRTDYKTRRKWAELAANKAHFNRNQHESNQIAEVYAIADYTQKMCEMSGVDFAQHVKNNGLKVYG